MTKVCTTLVGSAVELFLCFHTPRSYKLKVSFLVSASCAKSDARVSPENPKTEFLKLSRNFSNFSLFARLRKKQKKNHAVRCVKSTFLALSLFMFLKLSSNFPRSFFGVKSSGFVRGVRFLFPASSRQTVSISQETTSEVCNYRRILLSLMKLSVGTDVLLLRRKEEDLVVHRVPRE